MKTYWKQLVPALAVVLVLVAWAGGARWARGWKTYWWEAGGLAGRLRN